MSRNEIQSWVIAAHKLGDDSDDESESTPTPIITDSALEWQAFLSLARHRVTQTSTKERTEFLSAKLMAVAERGELDLSQASDVFLVLTLTYPRYIDVASRSAVLEVLCALTRRDVSYTNGTKNNLSGLVEWISKWINNESARICSPATRNSSASSEHFVLITWCCALLDVSVAGIPAFQETPAWSRLILSLASLIDSLCGSASKYSIKHSSLVQIRRLLRRRHPSIPNVINTALGAAKSSSNPLMFAQLLGISVDVSLRLKPAAVQELGRGYVHSSKEDLMFFYTTHMITARTRVPAHSLSAFHDFISNFVNESELSSGLIAALERVLIRSPEVSLDVLASFLDNYRHQMSTALVKKLLDSILGCTKSSNAQVRAGSVDAFSSLVSTQNLSGSQLASITNDLLALPKAGKTSSPDHRQTLYAMVSRIKPLEEVSGTIAFTLPALLARESSDLVVPALRDALSIHFEFIITKDKNVPLDVTSTFVKETNGAKASIRRAFLHVVGSAFKFQEPADAEQTQQPWSDSSKKFAEALLPSLESALKATVAAPLNTAVGPMEGYVTIATFIHPFSPIAKPRRQELYDLLALTSLKPSFLVWDKVYTKLTTVDEELWLTRALVCAFTQGQADLVKNDSLRTNFGLAWLHVAVSSKHPRTRQFALASLKRLSHSKADLAHSMMLGAILHHIRRHEGKILAITEEESNPGSGQGRFSHVILALASFSDDFDKTSQQRIMSQWLVPAHHADAAPGSRQIWIEALQAAGLDPRDVFSNNSESMLEAVYSGAIEPKLLQASLSAAQTLAFIEPDTVLARLLEQIRRDMNSARLGHVTTTDLGIWKTEEGVTFVDVLASRKGSEIAKGKNQDIEKWEAQIRKDLAAKKAIGTPNLSKQDRALVDAQLKIESETRKRVQLLAAGAGRGFGLIRSMINSKVPQVERYITPIMGLLLGGALQLGPPLVGSAALDTYFCLAQACSTRLGTSRQAIAIATVRLFEIDILPSEDAEEPLSALALRIMYLLYDRSSKAPFDALSYSFVHPFLERILQLDGAGQPDEDGVLEQITLAMEIIQFHVPECVSIPAYPRTGVLRVILSAMSRYPQLAQTTASILVDIGGAIHTTATTEEVTLLIEGTLARESFARHACLQALQPFDLTDLDWSPILWLACFDADEQNATLANDLWTQNALDVAESFVQDMIPFLGHQNDPVRRSCALSFSEALDTHSEHQAPLLTALKELYREKAKVLGPEYDAYGMLVERSLDNLDRWPDRQAIGITLEHLSHRLSESEVVPLFDFLIKDEALGDRRLEVRQSMLAAGSAVVDVHGNTRLPQLLNAFETYLAQQASPSETSDYIHEAVVILLGRLARHLEATDSRIPIIVDRLVEALKTPSEAVQVAVAECLALLAVPLSDKLGPLIDRLFILLTTAPKYGERRGAAYGIAGLVHGRGITTIKDWELLPRLKMALEDKKHFEARQGALFAFEMMSALLGRLFEPYVLEIVPLLLTSLGDQTPDVREATQDASKIIMANMSGYCVKSVLPSLLEGLDEKQWRTKKGSIELLGSMAYLAPKQLSVSLPTVIPRLTGVLTDAHAQVRAAASKSLKRFGEVINNPEVRSLVPSLLKAFVDPDKINNALAALLKKSFVHYIDSPSLALLIPILERGMRERSSETKRKAARIVGNLASLTDSKDFIPYLPRLMPLVHVVLVDPVPEARATAAKALGSLIERLGEANFPDLVSRLLQTLKTDTSGVDRQGAAQGLSEVLSGLGMDRMEALLPDVITNANSPRPYVREGFMSLLVFLPATFGHRFAPYLFRIIPPILSGLADVEEYVRAASMKAGRMVIVNYSSKAVDLLLPELERGMFDSSWRIRHSSITLVGELLYKVSGISGKNEIDEDEVGEGGTLAADNSRKALGEALGRERRDRILGSLYIVRQDSVAVVRQASMHIWKALVHNTPRTVREILVTLIDQIVALLAEGEDQRETAARTMGEICRKLGEKILGEVVPILRRGAEAPDARTRAGICFAISEVLISTTDAHREGHEEDIISAVRMCLVDESSDVRVAAAQSFDTLQEHIGNRAIDQTIPTLLEALRRPGAGSGTALQALREIMTVRANTVFPILIPTLVTAPMTAFNANALASLVTVAGSSLSKRLAPILTGLVTSLETERSPEVLEAVQGATVSLVASVNDIEGLHSLMMALLAWSKNESPVRRASAASTFATFCANTDLEFSTYRVDWIRQLVTLLDDRERIVHEAAWHALDEFVKSIDKDEMDVLVAPLRRTIESIGAPGVVVPGLSLDKGIAPILPIILAGLTGGNNEQREHAAYSIADLVERTSETSIRPYTTQLTGPLIRVITQATTSPPPVKGGILHALGVMLERIPVFIKPFFPQLQRTFVKSLTDASLSVRLRAIAALTVLMKHQPRVDPLISELIGAIRSNDEAVAGSVASALAGVITSARLNVSEANCDVLLRLVSESFGDSHEDAYNAGVAEIFAALSSDAALVQPILQTYVLGPSPPHVLTSQILLKTVAVCPQLYFTLGCIPMLIKKMHACIGADQPSISRPARDVKEILRSEPSWVDDESVQSSL